MPLRWFRFGKKQTEDRPETPAEEGVVTPAEPAEAAEGEPDTGSPATARKRRRRGSRGGRGRKKAGAQGVSGAEESEREEPGETEPERAGPERTAERKTERTAERKAERRGERKGAKAGRRRTPTRRAPLPAAKRELLISVDVGEQRVAVIEDDRVAEVYLERPGRRSIAGNIYLGVVDNVLPGMEAAFVEIGLEKNGFLYVDEIVGPELEGRKGARKIQDLIKRGQTVLVQAVKDPMKSKGARLTTEISLPGRFLVYVPSGEGFGVSRRLDEQERTRLKDIVKSLDAKGGGIIVRTAAEGASAEDVERDLVFLQRLWKTIQVKAKSSTAPALVYEEAELPLRIVRDLFAGDFLGAKIDDDRTYRRIVGYLKKTSPHMVERVHRYREKTPLFETYGVDEEIRSTLNRRVDLPSGGYLVFDYAEAFTVVDVNTGRFVGSRARSSGARLEDTIVKNNLEAVKEVVRQLRLRDIGGIIVIDFIDMANPKNRETVEEALRSELERDRTKTYVVEISPLGLVEMTRQNVTDGPREILTSKCAACGGDGIVVSDATHAVEVERRLRALARGSRVQAFRVEVHPRVLSLLAGPGGERLAALEALTRRRFFLAPAAGNGHVHLDHLEVVGQGKVDALRPQAPVSEGETIELKLVEVGLHDPGAGVGKLDGVEVVVADAAKLVGKKVSATVGRVLEGIAFATLADRPAAPEPITFEAEAEKPTRAPARRKAEEAPGEEEREEQLPQLEAAPPAEAAVEPAAEETPSEDGAPRKRRTRRGTRGGRGRAKAAAAAAGAEEPAEATEPVPAGPRAAGNGHRRPRIHVPPPDLHGGEDAATAGVAEPATPTEAGVAGQPAADGEPRRKRTRRGTRGGRRRRKSVTGEPEAGAETEPAPEDEPEPALEPAAVAAELEPGEPGYVPMAEWIEDFDRR